MSVWEECECRQDVTEHLRSIEGAPSVPIQDVPAIWNKEKKEEEEDPEKREDGKRVGIC